MKQFAVIGDPIAHSLSPVLHDEVYRQLGIDASFEKIQVQPDALLSFIESNQLDGFNVTIPHKQAVLPFLDELDEAANAIGAVNCVHNGKGYNTDWVGFLKAMELNYVELEDKNCLILGAGGAAKAIAFALVNAGVRSISIHNRTQKNADQLLDWINSIFPNNCFTEKPEIIINCTPLGMWPDIESVPEIDITSKQVLVDTIYNPLETKWLLTGKELGTQTLGGLDMFIAQGLASADIWFGEKISKKVNIDKIRQLLITTM
ncbi:MAG: shikimate dehydrogenase [Candidatus Marinimicrobia bacterium]|jgi:shikimate dehydrogenase|nr:shikimate dehydrogenase [Candidatus Neomarinimicrobiota bacterium]MDP7330948.1 shikimate dehydrogenase [Candidatus Neomarinimicrobiota bacterium]|tara:strand:+ start:30 stop:812 length:783 start_codon:yes stop_codon:yes gene_type:complete